MGACYWVHLTPGDVQALPPARGKHRGHRFGSWWSVDGFAAWHPLRRWLVLASAVGEPLLVGGDPPH